MTTIKSWSESDWKSIVSLKDEIYEGGKQYNSKADIWEANKTTMSKTEPADTFLQNQWNNVKVANNITAKQTYGK